MTVQKGTVNISEHCKWLSMAPSLCSSPVYRRDPETPGGIGLSRGNGERAGLHICELRQHGFKKQSGARGQREGPFQKLAGKHRCALASCRSVT